MNNLNIELKIYEGGDEVMSIDADGTPYVILAIIKAAETYVNGKLPAAVGATPMLSLMQLQRG